MKLAEIELRPNVSLSMWYADDEAEDAFCCLTCESLVPGARVVIGFDPERVVRLRCVLCGTVHTIREPTRETMWIGTFIEIER